MTEPDADCGNARMSESGQPGTGVSRRQFLGRAGAMVALSAMLPAWMSAAWVSRAAPLEQALFTAYRVPGLPFDTITGVTTGPGAWNAVYGSPRQFFPVADGTRTGAVWQSLDPADGGQIFVTWFSANPDAAENTVRLVATGDRLAAATSDEAGVIFLFIVERGNGAPNAARRATLTRIAPNGAPTSVILDTGRDGLDMVAFEAESHSASLAVAQGQVVLMVARTMHQSPDGLNHQGSIARLFDANTLAVTQSPGQTGSHSWANTMTRSSQGHVIAAEINDNFPRGIQIHRFTPQGHSRRVVYTYKTLHGTSATSPAGQTFPPATDFSTPAQTFFQWSNDNQTYTELGGVAEASNGYLVAFAGERNSLNNSHVGASLNAPRNLGVVVVRKDFEAAAPNDSPTWVPDDLILTQGAVEESGYYTFFGQFSRQRVKGVVWLTEYPADLSRHASRIKVARLDSGDILLLWEVWSQEAYLETFWMTVRPEGAGVTVVRPATSLGTQVRLNPRDDLIVLGGQVIAMSGDGANRRLIVTAFGANGPEPLAGVVATPTNTPLPTATATLAATETPTPVPPDPTATATSTTVPNPPAQPEATVAATPTQDQATQADPTATATPTQGQAPQADPTATATPSATPTAPTQGPPPTAAGASEPVPMDVAVRLVSAMLGGWTTSVGPMFMGAWAGDTIEASLTVEAGALAGTYLLAGKVTGPDRITGTLTRDPASQGAGPLSFDMTVAADRRSFRGTIAGLTPAWTGNRQE